MMVAVHSLQSLAAHPEKAGAAALSIPVRRSDHNRIVEAVGTPLDIAKAWA